MKWRLGHASPLRNLSCPVNGGILLLSQRSNRRSLAASRHASYPRISAPSWICSVAWMGFRRAGGAAASFDAADASGRRARGPRPPQFFLLVFLPPVRLRNTRIPLLSPSPPPQHHDPPP